MLTGDNQRTAAAVGKEVGVTDVRAELLPEDKLKVVKQLREKHQHVDGHSDQDS